VACEECSHASNARRLRLQLLDRFGSSAVSAGFLDAIAAGATISASLVVSELGEFTGVLGSSQGISDSVDRAWLSRLRRNSQVVLTSGETFRVEQYRMPKTADLAVLTRGDLDTTALEPKPGQRFHLLKDSDSFESSVADVQELGYRSIHIEFGPTGIAALVKSQLRFSLFLSGPSWRSIEIAAQSLGAHPIQLCQVDGLHIAKAR
jgi:hypothetical protein